MVIFTAGNVAGIRVRCSPGPFGLPLPLFASVLLIVRRRLGPGGLAFQADAGTESGIGASSSSTPSAPF
jgi:hypothetical protein